MVRSPLRKQLSPHTASTISELTKSRRIAGWHRALTDGGAARLAGADLQPEDVLATVDGRALRGARTADILAALHGPVPPSHAFARASQLPHVRQPARARVRNASPNLRPPKSLVPIAPVFCILAERPGGLLPPPLNVLRRTALRADG